MKITLEGEEKLLQTLNKMAQMEVIVYGWMKGGMPDAIMQRSFRLNFGRQGREDKWQELAESTIQQRDYEGYSSGPILQRTGNLMDAVSSIIGVTTTSGKDVQKSWGIEQLSGLNAAKFKTHQAGDSSKKIPARPMIGFQNADGNNLMKSLAEYISIELQ
jgi:phage gpG-like protein